MTLLTMVIMATFIPFTARAYFRAKSMGRIEDAVLYAVLLFFFVTTAINQILRAFFRW